ncbi:hypothetical protein [Natronorubrum sp. DTA28]|uniref:hypothetical protein n=1 Tax=Natronorubrum sp. DTA28 TaxID=3447019 RepID=UPI003F87AB0E
MTGGDIPREDVEGVRRVFELMHGSEVRHCFEHDKEFTEEDKIKATVWELAIEELDELLDPEAENPGLSEEDVQESDVVEKSRRWRDIE